MRGERTRDQIRDDVDQMRAELLQYAEDLEDGQYASRSLLYYPILDADVEPDAWDDDPGWAASVVHEQILNASLAQIAAYHAYASLMLEL
jgi:hypothetical protein